ncbi:MAG: ABC transporter ATP-binding protein [Candidatus Omnitrophica bacterium]|nr:ABC transporter ATP-binding protein [Candidatus Omnitrophota bacterium]MBU4488512.1 ABC transporter ATP-binding protein [Candidatus Omnitrophota bacterium]MCG2704576.1 ABC transporter ATP-binding protein [Candidatus Omnitrophota bacterium]
MRKIIEFKSVKLGYGRKIIFDGLNFDIYEGDFLGIVGPNGSGKTTLLRSIMGLLKPASGQITRDANLRFGYCMQRQFIDTLFPFTVFEIVMMARAKIIGSLKKPSGKDKDTVLQAMEAVGILDLSSECFYNLSGGQKQKVLIARALALEPNFLVLDEPTTDLDIKAEREILELIKTLHFKKNLTVALVTHELNEVINLAQKFMFLNKSIPHKIFKKEELSAELLSEIFDTEIKINEIDGKSMIL